MHTWASATVRRKTRPRNGGPTMRVGDRVRFDVPDNVRLHGTEGKIREIHEWGAVCEAPGAASRQFRATWEEMQALVDYAGECCDACGSLNLRWAGKCKVCENCGSTGGCG